MRTRPKLRDSGCPLAYGLDIFGDRWSLLVIREMMLNGKTTFGDFAAIDEKIATNVLADRLKHLEAEGIVEKSRDPENRRRLIYSLTPKGRDLAPVLIEIILWGDRYDKRPQALRAAPEKIKADRAAFEAFARSDK